MVKCGKCGTPCVDEYADLPERWWTCPRCGNEDTAAEHVQERDRRINEASLAISAGRQVTIAIAVHEAQNLIDAQDEAAQARP